MIIMGPFSENLETLEEQQLISIPREDHSNRKEKPSLQGSALNPIAGKRG